MLGNNTVITTIAVHDLENAITFYSEVLGLTFIGKNFPGANFESGSGTIGIYESITAGTGQSTCAWWTVSDVVAMVNDLKSKGVKFEKNYDLPHIARKGEVYLLSETHMAVWFKDPDGNILGFGNF